MLGVQVNPMKLNLKFAFAGLFGLTNIFGSFLYSDSQATTKAISDFQVSMSSQSGGTGGDEVSSLTSAEQSTTEMPREQKDSEESQATLSSTATGAETSYKPEMTSAEALDAFLGDLSSNPIKDDRLFWLVRSLQGEDIVIAFNAVQELGTQLGASRTPAHKLVNNLAKEDPKSALSLAYEIRGNAYRSQVVGSVLGQWGYQEPYAFLEWLGADQNYENAKRVVGFGIQAAFAEIAKKDIYEARDLLESLREDDRLSASYSMLDVLISLGGIDSGELADFITSRPKKNHGWLVSKALGNDELENFDDRMAFAQSVEGTNPDLAAIIYDKVAKSKISADGFAERAKKNAQIRELSTRAQEIARTDLSEAQNFINNMDQAYRQRAALAILTDLIYRKKIKNGEVAEFMKLQPKQHYRYLVPHALTSLGGFEDRIALAQSVESTHPDLAKVIYQQTAALRARNYPEETVEWSFKLSNADAQRQVLEAVAWEWTSHNIEEAGQWLLTTVSDPIYDGAYSHFAQKAAEFDPANAITWAEGITASPSRDSAVSQVASIWAKTDREAAIDYVQYTEYLSAPAREKLLTTLSGY